MTTNFADLEKPLPGAKEKTVSYEQIIVSYSFN